MLGIYCRNSKYRKNQVTIETQKAHGIEFAEREGFEYETYIDEGITGKGDGNNRPEFKRFFSDLKSGRITAVYIYNRDRYDRDIETWIRTANHLKDNRIPLYVKGEYKDLTNPETYYALVRSAVRDQEYIDELRVKIKDALEYNARNGKPFSINPYGYKTETQILENERGREMIQKKLVIDEEESKIVHRMFQMSLDGIGTDSIAKILNREGIKTRRGARWHSRTIQGIIKNPIHKGLRVWGEKSGTPEYIDIPELASMPVEYWDRVNKNFKNNLTSRGAKEKHNYLLRHLLMCGECGRNYVGRFKKDKSGRVTDNYYQCSSKRMGYNNCGNRSINIDYIESLIWKKFIEEGEIIQLIKSYFNRPDVDARIGELKEKIISIQSAINENKKKEQRLLDSIEDGLSKELIRKRITKIENTSEHLNKELNNAAQQLETHRDKNKIELMKSELSDFENLSFLDKRNLLQKYLCPIIVRYLPDRNEFFEGGEYFVSVGLNINFIDDIVFVISRDYKQIAAMAMGIEKGSITLDKGIFSSKMHDYENSLINKAIEKGY